MTSHIPTEADFGLGIEGRRAALNLSEVMMDYTFWDEFLDVYQNDYHKNLGDVSPRQLLRQFFYWLRKRGAIVK